MNATSGQSYFLLIGIHRWPLGGNVTPSPIRVKFKYFHPINNKRNAMGLRFLGA